MAKQADIELPSSGWIDKELPGRVPCQANHQGRVKPLARYRITQGTSGQDISPWYACLPCTRKAILHRERHDERLNLQAERKAGMEDMEDALDHFGLVTGVALAVTSQHIQDGASGHRLLTMTPDQIRHLARLLTESPMAPRYVTMEPYRPVLALAPGATEKGKLIPLRGRKCPE